MSLTTDNRQSARFTGIDMCRSVAILLVTATHCLSAFGTDREMTGVWLDLAQYAFQTATPVFLVMFGAMLELVYLKRLRCGRGREVAERLFGRAMQCYAFYVANILALFVFAGAYSFASLPVAAMFMISVPFANLLAFYAVALLLAPALLVVRNRHGLLPLILAALALHVAYPLVMQLPVGPEIAGRSFLSYLTGFLYGVGSDFYGPSLVHGLTLVVAGLVLGRGLETAARTPKQGFAVLFVLFLAGAIPATLMVVGPDETASLPGLLDMSLRRISHPLYFAMGLSTSVVMTVSLVLVYDRLNLRTGRSLCVFGRNSLFVFGFGTLLINAVPGQLSTVTGPWAASVSVFLAICLLTISFDRLKQMESRNMLMGLVSRANRYSTVVAQALVRLGSVRLSPGNR